MAEDRLQTLLSEDPIKNADGHSIHIFLHSLVRVGIVTRDRDDFSLDTIEKPDNSHRLGSPYHVLELQLLCLYV